MKRALHMLGLLAAAVLVPLAVLHAQAADSGQRAARAEIVRLEEQFRAAKIANDVAALGEVLHEAFVETNQNGNSRDRAGMLDLFRTFDIVSLTTDQASIRVTGDVAVVDGSQTEIGACGQDAMLFTRVYVREDGLWRLISSTQFRNPLLTQVALTPR